MKCLKMIFILINLNKIVQELKIVKYSPSKLHTNNSDSGSCSSVYDFNFNIILYKVYLTIR